MKAQFALQPHRAAQPEKGEDAVVTVEGEIDSSNAEDFERAARERCPDTRIVLDLAPLEYCDSAGFAALDRLVANEVAVIVIGPDRPIRKAAALLNLPFHGTIAEALRSIGAG